MSAGTYFGKFFLLKRLAQGGMGEIYVARQQGPGGFSKTVALKKILPHLTENKDFIQGFLGEAALSAKMTHRNIVQVFDFGLDEETNSYYLTMEYIAGKPLNDILDVLRQRRERMPLGLVKDIAIQMCDGMSYAHNLMDDLGQPLNLVHRDLNPSNLLISYHGDVKIIDWGIAKSEMSQVKTEAGMIKGKFVYMSPEQSMAKELDKRSDVFAAGITLYEMLTGENPFHKPNIVLSLEAIQRTDPPPPSEFDPAFAGFDAIVARALAKDKERRYPDCAVMAEDLKALVIPPASERVGALVSRLFRADFEQESKLLQETGAHKITAARSVPQARVPAPAPAPYVPEADDEKGGTLVLGNSEADQERLRLEMEAARRKLEAAQAAHRAATTGSRSRPQPVAYEEAEHTLMLGADELNAARAAMPAPRPSAVAAPPPSTGGSKKGLFIGIFAGVFVGLVGVGAFLFLSKPAEVPEEPPRVVVPPVVEVKEPSPPVEEKVEKEPERVEHKPEPEPSRRDAELAERQRAEREAAEAAARAEAERARAEAERARAEEQRARAEREAREAAAAKPVVAPPAALTGSFIVRTIPSLPVSQGGKLADGSGQVPIRGTAGRIDIGGADDPFRVTFNYRIENGKAFVSVGSEPWSILHVGELSRGRVPQDIEIGGKLQKLEFKRPGVDSPQRVMVMFTTN